MAKKSKGEPTMVESTPYDDKYFYPDSDLRTLVEAEKIKRNPKRMKAAKELAKKRLEDTAKVLAADSD